MSDSCGGFFNVFFNDPFNFQGQWNTRFLSGALCTVNVNAFAADGQFQSFQLNVPLL